MKLRIINSYRKGNAMLRIYFQFLKFLRGGNEILRSIIYMYTPDGELKNDFT